MIFNPDRYYVIRYIVRNEDSSRDIIEEPFLYFAKMFILERGNVCKYSVRILEKDWIKNILLIDDSEGNMVSLDGNVYYTIDYDKGILYSKDYDMDFSDY